MLLIPGVAGSSDAPYIKVMAKRASESGFIPVVVNALHAKNEEDYRVLDFSDSKILRDAVDKIHDKLGDDIEIYGIGFSLGANHLLRYIGDNPDNNGLKAAISVSNPFDVLATCVRLKYTLFGIYDKAIAKNLALPFIK